MNTSLAAYRILNVNDDPVVRHAISRILARAGLGVTEAETAAAALREMDKQLPDLALVDVVMPDVDGFELCTQIRQHPRAAQLPVVILSAARQDLNSKARGLDSGADSYLTWPVNQDVLVTTIKSVLRVRQAEARLRESEEGFRTTFEQVSVGLGHLTLDGKWTWANRRLCQIFGYTLEELLQRSCVEVLCPDDQQAVLEHKRQILAGEAESFALEQRCRRKDGSVFWASWTVSLARKPDGQPHHFVAVMEDISVRKWTEENLLLIRAGIEGSSEAISVADAQGQHAYHNAAFARMFGYRTEDLTEPPVAIAIFADQAVGRTVFETTKHGQSWHGEVEMAAKDGRRFPVELRADAIRDERGQLIGLIGIHTDITERKRAAETMRRNEARFRCLANVLQYRGQTTQEFLDFALQEAIALTGSKLGYIYFYHEDRKQFVLNTWSREVMTECAIAQPQTCHELDKTSLWGEAVRQRRPIILNDFQAAHPLKKGYPKGHVALHRYLTVPVFSGDQIVAVAAVANKERDYDNTDIEQLQLLMDAVWKVVQKRNAVAELAASEERFRRAVVDSPFPTMLHAEDGTVLQVSNSWCEITGYTREELATVADWTQRAYGEQAKSVLAGVKRLYDLDKRVAEGDFTIRTKSGDTRVWEFSSAPLGALRDGRRVVISVAMDITERRRLEQQRLAMEAQLRHQQKLESMGTLAGGVAHEINNPVNGIMNYAQLIQDRLPEGSPLTEFTGEILQETQRVATIVRNLLTFARSEKQSHSPARMADIIEGTLSLIRTVIRHDQITLTVNLPAGLPDIKCRTQQIQQVLMNLMTNARDALNERYPGHDADKVLIVSAHLLEKEGWRWIRVTVEDHGTGITPEVRERMFDPFFTTKPRDQGTGLGLSISHGIVKEHHGQLWFETEVGKGSRFHLDLPVEPAEPGGTS